MQNYDYGVQKKANFRTPRPKMSEIPHPMDVILLANIPPPLHFKSKYTILGFAGSPGFQHIVNLHHKRDKNYLACGRVV